MPFVIIALGILLIVVGIRNTQTQLGKQIQTDFTGQGNFFYWIAAIMIIGALGYIDELRAPSRAMLALVLIALIFSNQGFFNKFVQQIQSGSAQAPPPGPPVPTINPTPTPAASGAGGSSSSGGIQNVVGLATAVGGILGV